MVEALTVAVVVAKKGQRTEREREFNLFYFTLIVV